MYFIFFFVCPTLLKIVKYFRLNIGEIVISIFVRLLTCCSYKSIINNLKIVYKVIESE